MKKKIVRLTENQLNRIVKRVINEDEMGDQDKYEYELGRLMYKSINLLKREHGIPIDYLEELNEYELIDLLEERKETELASKIQYYLDKLYSDPNETYEDNYVNKIVKELKPPYFINLMNIPIGMGQWEKILSQVFNQKVKVKVKIPNYDGGGIYDENGNRIYYETFKGTWSKHKYNENGNLMSIELSDKNKIK
jgi:hypothetical protein